MYLLRCWKGGGLLLLVASAAGCVRGISLLEAEPALDLGGDLRPSGDARGDHGKADGASSCVTYRQVQTLAGSGESGYLDGPALVSRFNHPYDLAIDAAGRVFVADRDNHRIRLIAGGQVTTFAGTGISGSADGPVDQAAFFFPTGVAVDEEGRVFVADKNSHRLRLIDKGQVTTIAGEGQGYQDGPAAQARFQYPFRLRRSPAGNLLLLEEIGRVRRMAGGQVSTVLSTTSSDLGGMLLLDEDRFLISFYGSSVIKRWDGTSLVTVAGSTPGFLDGPALDARLDGPNGLAMGSCGEIWIADEGNHAIRRLYQGQLTTLTGKKGAGHLDGPLDAATFNHPTALATGPDGSLYLSEWSGQRVRVITP